LEIFIFGEGGYIGFVKEGFGDGGGAGRVAGPSASLRMTNIT
jgi:hypothetical protein